MKMTMTIGLGSPETVKPKGNKKKETNTQYGKTGQTTTTTMQALSDIPKQPTKTVSRGDTKAGYRVINP
jgi:hypothetical protein